MPLINGQLDSPASHLIEIMSWQHCLNISVDNFSLLLILLYCSVLSFQIDRTGQTVWTHIRRLLKENLIRVYTIRHFLCIVWMHFCVIKPYSSNFRITAAIFSGIWIFWIVTVETRKIRHRNYALHRLLPTFIIWAISGDYGTFRPP